MIKKMMFVIPIIKIENILEWKKFVSKLNNLFLVLY